MIFLKVIIISWHEWIIDVDCKKVLCKTHNIVTNKCNKYFVPDVEMDLGCL